MLTTATLCWMGLRLPSRKETCWPSWASTGAGKSTLLKCLNRVLRPQGGSVLLGGNNLLRLPQDAIARRIGYVPQQHSQTRLTVYEAVLLGRRPHMGMTVSKADYTVVEETLQRMGLSDLALRPVSDLSGGEVQKVMLARAMAQSPKILLLDEPTSNLDLKNQIEVMGPDPQRGRPPGAHGRRCHP